MDIKQKVEKVREQMLARRKERYAYARSKGFTSYECNLLAGYSIKRIDDLAESEINEQ